MSLNLVQLAADDFQRANENPLSDGGLWTAPGSVNNAGLQIVSDKCQSSASVDTTFAGQYFNGSALPDDQYASLTIATLEAESDAEIQLWVRASGSGIDGNPTVYYSLGINVIGSGSSYSLEGPGVDSGGSVTVSEGDVWTLAAVGETIYVIQNGVVLSASTGASSFSGGAFYSLNYAFGTQGSLQLSNVAIGFVPIISGNAGVAGATISWSGTSSGSMTADGSGNFSISGLAAGSYTITPSLTDYSFSPTSASETLGSSSITGVNFTATQTAWNISGNAGEPGATVSYTGTASGSVTADSLGNYLITGLANGPYTITPTYTGSTFVPTSRSETISSASISGVNFTLFGGGNNNAGLLHLLGVS